jgi:hypothetical protein
MWDGHAEQHSPENFVFGMDVLVFQKFMLTPLLDRMGVVPKQRQW